jgi:hypothetical protein
MSPEGAAQATSAPPTALLALLWVIYDNPYVRVILALLLVNVILGVAAALYTRTFDWQVQAEWLLTRALPYVLVAGAFQLAVAMVAGYESVLGQYSDFFKATQLLVWGSVIAALIAHIADSLKNVGVAWQASHSS